MTPHWNRLSEKPNYAEIVMIEGKTLWFEHGSGAEPVTVEEALGEPSNITPEAISSYLEWLEENKTGSGSSMVGVKRRHSQIMK